MPNFAISLLTGLSFLSVLALGQPEFNPSKNSFEQICMQNRRGAHQVPVPPVQAGAEAYIPMLALEATQNRYSFRRMLESMKKLREEEKNWFSHDGGRSVYGTKKRLKTVYYRGKYFIVDGHHRALISVYLGAITIPALVLADLSELSEKQFRATMEERGWAHWKDHFGQPVAPVDLCEMTDAPNFQLARLLLLKVDAQLVDGRAKISKSSGARVPLAIKLNGDIPFFEIHLADALRRNGVIFDDQRGEEDLRENELLSFHRILTQEARANSSPLNKVLLLDKPTPVAELNLEEIITEHMRSNFCTIALRSPSHEI